MEEEDIGSGAGGGGGGGGGSSSRVSPASTSAVPPVTTKGRQRFTVELRIGETTFVSWKKLIKEDSSSKIKPNNNSSSSLPSQPELPPPTGAHPALESRVAPLGQNGDEEMKDVPPSSRFSAVIEKIERLYMGKQSSDEEELDDIPDDDQYDTEDSFIDDAELDQYFQVDKSATKHNGFFVNRGKLERINEHVPSPDHLPKKRRRKDLTRTSGERDAGHLPNKHAKLGNVKMKAAARTAPFAGNVPISSHTLTPESDHFQNGKLLERMTAPLEPLKKKLADSKVNSLSSKVQAADASACPSQGKNTDKHKDVVVQSRDLGNKSKSESLSNAHQIHRDASTSTQPESQIRKVLNDADELEPSTKVQQRRKDGSNELFDHQVRRVKSTLMHAKEGSSVRSKGTMLERAIRELELIVSESRPQSMEAQDTDNSFPGIKRRLPREVKQKLAKVARLAQSSQGKISEELINRLMGILGHIVQLKTLKRNLKAMVELGLSAKQEKDDRFQQIKKEVIEMIRTRASSLKSKPIEAQDGTLDDRKEAMDSKEKGLVTGTCSMDDAMEDKICDLYDLYVEGMDEDKGPQIRKLYVELAELWPNGLMDNHGIKNAVCRAKERKRAYYGRLKGNEKLKRKKPSSTPRTADERVSAEASSIPQQPRAMVDRITSENNSEATMSINKMASNTQTTISQQQTFTSDKIMSSSATLTKSSSGTDNRLKQEKTKCSSSSFLDKARKTLDGVLKPKVKRKSESESGDNNSTPCAPPEKLSLSSQQLQQGKERFKAPKQAVVNSSNQQQKSTLQSSSSAALTGNQQQPS